MNNTTEIPWGDDIGLGQQWWLDNGKIVSATPEQIKFAACFHQNWTATASARAAGFQASEENMRQSGHRASRSTAVCALLNLAHAATGVGPSGNVDLDEAKGILSRLARTSDAGTRIRSLELLVRIDEREKERELEQGQQTDIRTELAEVEKISPDLARSFAKMKGIPYGE